MDTHELAWAAGFFDGEGHVRTNICGAANGKMYPQLNIRIEQCDEHVLRRFQHAVGCGYVSGPYQRKGREAHRPIWAFTASNFEDAQAIMAKLWRFLCEPKQAQFHTAFVERHKYPFGKSRPKKVD